MKKVMFNTWPGAFQNPGGGEVQLENSKIHLEKKGQEILLYNPWEKVENIDIFHQFSIEPGLENLIYDLKKRGIKIALSTILWTIPDKSHFRYHQIKFLLDQADILFTNSDAESERIQANFDIHRSKFHKTRNSITNDFLKLSDESLFRNKFNIHGEFILSVANIDDRKNTKRLVEACKKIKKELVLIGAIRDHEYYNSIDFDDSVTFLGALDDKELIKSAMNACQIFALPSICETPGIAALEAGSQGAKIVITEEGATREYFNDLAYYVNPHSIDSISETLEKSWQRTKSKDIADFVCNNYTWDKTASDILNGYNKL